MKMPNFKKYIFSYIYIFSTFLFYYCVWRYSQVEHPQVGPDDYFNFGDDAFEFFSKLQKVITNTYNLQMSILITEIKKILEIFIFLLI